MISHLVRSGIGQLILIKTFERRRRSSSALILSNKLTKYPVVIDIFFVHRYFVQIIRRKLTNLWAFFFSVVYGEKSSILWHQQFVESLDCLDFSIQIVFDAMKWIEISSFGLVKIGIKFCLDSMKNVVLMAEIVVPWIILARSANWLFHSRRHAHFSLHINESRMTTLLMIVALLFLFFFFFFSFWLLYMHENWWKIIGFHRFDFKSMKMENHSFASCALFGRTSYWTMWMEKTRLPDREKKTEQR